jgi:hypothetical protein
MVIGSVLSFACALVLTVLTIGECSGQRQPPLQKIPRGDTITVNYPVTHNSMESSKWFSETRNSFLKLSILIGKALDVDLQ